jgi:hypothetical protein
MSVNRAGILTVRKTKRDAGPKHVRVRDGKLRHPHRFSGPIYVDDGFFRPFYMWMTEFSVTYTLPNFFQFP